MSTTSPNKQLVLDTWEALRTADVRSAFRNMHDDVTWWIPGMIEPISGLRRGKEDILGFLRWAAQTFPTGFRSEVRGVYEDGDRVVLELVNRSTTAAGAPYENEYCFVFELREGRIAAVREYVDTQKAVAVFGGAAAS